MNDANDLRRTTKAMRHLNFAETNIRDVLQLTASILNLGMWRTLQKHQFLPQTLLTSSELWPSGNIEMKGVQLPSGDGSEITNTTQAQLVASMLGVDIEALKQALCFRSVTIVGETSWIPLKLSDGLDNRNALAKVEGM